MDNRKIPIDSNDEETLEYIKVIGATLLCYFCWFSIIIGAYNIFLSPDFAGLDDETTLEMLKPIFFWCSIIAIILSGFIMTFITFQEQYKKQILISLAALSFLGMFT